MVAIQLAYFGAMTSLLSIITAVHVNDTWGTPPIFFRCVFMFINTVGMALAIGGGVAFYF